jgi:hypothetical protein
VELSVTSYLALGEPTTHVLGESIGERPARELLSRQQLEGAARDDRPPGGADGALRLLGGQGGLGGGDGAGEPAGQLQRRDRGGDDHAAAAADGADRVVSPRVPYDHYYWIASMDKLGEATVPALRYSSEEVEAIELYMRTLTVQAKEAAKPVD